MRLDIDRQNNLEPKRMLYAKSELEKLGYNVEVESNFLLKFMHKDSEIQLFPYSGWHSGKTIKDGRGLNKLLKQLNRE